LRPGLGEAFTLNGRSFTPLPVNHVVPACGLHVATPTGSLVFSVTPRIATPLSQRSTHSRPAPPHHRTSFENELIDIAKASKHHWPDSLAAELQNSLVE